MEDIKILKEMKENCLTKREYIDPKAERKALAIENILGRLEQLEKELEPIHKLGIPVKTVVAELNRLEDDREQLKIRIKELENEQKQEYKVENRNIEILEENYVPKSVIREKIEELEKRLPLVIGGRSQGKTYTFIIQFTIKSFKELLGEEK